MQDFLCWGCANVVLITQYMLQTLPIVGRWVGGHTVQSSTTKVAGRKNPWETDIHDSGLPGLARLHLAQIPTSHLVHVESNEFLT